jgi:PAS domain S-box-containing protein
MRQAEEAAQEKALHWQTTFDAISDCIFLLDTRGRVLQCNQAMADLLQQPADAILGQLLADAAPATLDFTFLPVNERAVRQTVEAQIGEKWFQVTTATVHGGSEVSGSVHVMTDITKRKQAEEENIRLLHETQEAAVRQRAFMRDILKSVTEGKLRLCDSPADLPPPLQSAGETVALTSDSLMTLRTAAREVLTAQNFSKERVTDMTTAASEAGMNAVVHAGGGTASIFTDGPGDKVQIWVQDHGGGIAVDRLPLATLQRGYTTAGTLGHGFKMMLQTADRVWLLTGITGTTVVIEQDRHAPVTLLG